MPPSRLSFQWTKVGAYKCYFSFMSAYCFMYMFLSSKDEHGECYREMLSQTLIPDMP